MHFDRRTQAALSDVGIDIDDLRGASDAIGNAVAAYAKAIESFFDDHETVYSDASMTHSNGQHPEHTVRYLEHPVRYLGVTTHAGEMRGWLRSDTWDAFVKDGHVLGEEYVELSLGSPIHGRGRFATDRAPLQ